MTYCTLFDSNYLDRGLVLLDSLKAVDSEIKVYVLCMDDICYEILDNEKGENVKLMALKDFETEDLLKVKAQRSRGEYCWTCTAVLIKYVLSRFSEDICTYIDADMKFYSNPTVLIDEMHRNACFVQTIPHRFAPDKKRLDREKASGRNCVQFNTFTNTAEGMAILNNWIDCCMQECSIGSGGDQKYTDSWTENKNVNISANIGAGVAPWNINRYVMKNQSDLVIKDIYDGTEGKIVFYHFQDLVFPKEGIARVIPFLEYWNIDKKMVKFLYEDYLHDLYLRNQYLLNKYNHKCCIKSYISEKNTDDRTLIERIINWIEKPLYEKIQSLNYKIRIRLRRKTSEFIFGNRA